MANTLCSYQWMHVCLLCAFSHVNSVQSYGLRLTRLFCSWILKTRILEWVAMPSSKGSFWHGDQTSATWEASSKNSGGLVAKLCLTLGNPMDCNLPGFTVHGILQARIWSGVAISFSRVSCQPRDQTQVFCIAGRFFTNWTTREAHQRMIEFKFLLAHMKTWFISLQM